jgi:hypothetical protein
MTLVVAIFIGFITQLSLFILLFDDFDDFAYQLRSVLAWLPVTYFLEYDFSDSSWSFWLWLVSGTVVGSLIFGLMS